ncbi:MAG TPA: secondary thiamine-phosphate synthase enzyme YjbQ [Prolixibacteraceae bacterium]|jgi:secondary thiamine-phosphate synthase enzyme
MIKQTEIVLTPRKRGYHLITKELESKLPALPNAGIAHFFIMHTSAGLTLNENADPSVRIDFESFMNKLIPDGDRSFIHRDEGDDDMSAHLKASILGAAVSIPIVNGRLHLGTWQGIYLCEFRNYGDSRKVFVTIMGE